MAKGFVNAGLVSPDSLIGSDPVPAGREAFSRSVGCETTDSNADVLAKAKVVFLAFKPHQLDEATEAVRDQFDESHLVISILAGVPLAKLDAACGGRGRVVRGMPHPPAPVGGGACGRAGAGTPEQAARNATPPTVPEAMLQKFTEATEALRKLQGPIIDQDARESRIH